MKKHNRSLRAILIIILLFLLFACSTDESLIGFKPTDAYFYRGYDSTGIRINQGWIRYNFVDSIRIKGEWRFESITYDEDIGDQIGHGELSGELHDNHVFFNLNPQYVDRNVFLIGTKREDVITGLWEWVTFPGQTNWGTFKAEK